MNERRKPEDVRLEQLDKCRTCLCDKIYCGICVSRKGRIYG